MPHLSCQPYCSAWLILAWLAAVTLLIFRSWQNQRQFLSKRYAITLAALRMTAALLVAIFFLRPTWTKFAAHPDGYRIAVLADASASMFLRNDAPDGQSRIQALKQLLPTLPDGPQKELLPFAAQTLNGTIPPTPLPGDTAVGRAIDAALETSKRPGALPLGAILLLSDGADFSPATAESSTIEAARRAKAAGVPISVCAIGTTTLPPDAAVAFTATQFSFPVSTTENQLTAAITGNFTVPQAVPATLTDAKGQVLGRQSVTLEPGAPVAVSFTLPPMDIPGKYSYAVRITPPEADQQPDNDFDGALVTIQAPPKRRILYLGAAPSWEWRLLRTTTAAHFPNVDLAAVIRIGNDNTAQLPPDHRPALKYYRLNVPAGEGFPQKPEDYTAFDGAIVECAATPMFSADACDALCAFVQHRGGGLLFTGNPTLLPPQLKKLLPGLAFDLHPNTAGSHLLLTPGVIFAAEAAPRLHQPAGVPVQHPYYVATRPKQVARTVLKDRSGAPLMLATANYGAGRVAWLGLTQTWQWAMNSHDGADTPAVYQEFWRGLTDWLGLNRQPSLQVVAPNNDLAAGVPATCAIRILAPNFLPALEAQATLRVTGPDNVTETLDLFPSVDAPGRYTAQFTPAEPGAYQMEYTAIPAPGALAVTAQALALVRQGGQESTQTAARPNLLADIARMTGGKFFAPSEPLRDLPVADTLPTTATPHHPLESLWFPILLIALWTTEWALRRRQCQP